MKSKWFLRGIGIGIIVTALLLCITYRSSSEDNNVIKQARELGMVFPKEETTDTKAEAEKMAQEVKDNPASKPAVSAVSKSAVGTDTKVSNEKDKKAKKKLEDSKKDIKNASAFQKGKTTFVVRNGLLSSSVAREMEEAGIIDDAKDFNAYLVDNGYGRRIRSGTYKIPEGADFSTIAKIITRQD